MFFSQGLERFALAGSVGACTPQAPRANFTGDPYFTDGFRAVVDVRHAGHLPEDRIRALGDPPRP